MPEASYCCNLSSALPIFLLSLKSVIQKSFAPLPSNGDHIDATAAVARRLCRGGYIIAPTCVRMLGSTILQCCLVLLGLIQCGPSAPAPEPESKVTLLLASAFTSCTLLRALQIKPAVRAANNTCRTFLWVLPFCSRHVLARGFVAEALCTIEAPTLRREAPL